MRRSPQQCSTSFFELKSEYKNKIIKNTKSVNHTLHTIEYIINYNKVHTTLINIMMEHHGMCHQYLL